MYIPPPPLSPLLLYTHKAQRCNADWINRIDERALIIQCTLMRSTNDQLSYLFTLQFCPPSSSSHLCTHKSLVYSSAMSTLLENSGRTTSFIHSRLDQLYYNNSQRWSSCCCEKTGEWEISSSSWRDATSWWHRCHRNGGETLVFFSSSFFLLKWNKWRSRKQSRYRMCPGRHR